MTKEAVQTVDLAELPIDNLAIRARKELQAIKQNIESRDHPIKRASLNINLVDQIRKEPAMHTLLEKNSQSVTLYNRGGILKVTSAGYIISWHDPEERENEFETIDEELLAVIHSGRFPGSAGRGMYMVRDLANLKPEQILEKFKRAIPIIDLS